MIPDGVKKQKVKDTIKNLPWEQINGEAYIEINKLLKELEVDESDKK